MKKLILQAALLACIAVAGNAHAVCIQGVTATTSFASPPGRGIEFITDGSGLSELSLSAAHARSFVRRRGWIGGGTAGSIDFDLHGVYNLNTLAVWNANIDSSRGVKDLTVYTSIDSGAFSLMAGAPTQFAQGPELPPEDSATSTAEVFSLAPTTTAAYVRFVISSNWGDTEWTGLAEIGFGGSPVSPVPEPETYALMLFGLAVVGAAAKRKASQAK